MTKRFTSWWAFSAILFSGVVTLGCSDGPSTTTGSGGGGGAGGEGQGGAGGGATVCMAGETKPCYTGPTGTSGVGLCKEGTQTCAADGSAFGACTGEVVPVTETCTTIEDEDCDGMANEDGEGCICVPGSMSACYTGGMGTEGVGICIGGMQTCNAAGTGYETCTGEVIPGVETCATPVDDDCDGMVNEDGDGCICVPGSVSACYTGPMGTAGVGICAMGMQTCDAMGTAYGPCVGEMLPGVETCATPEDDDCDGMVNEEGAGCLCVPGSMAPCYTGPMGTAGVGICAMGMQTCNPLGTAYGACMGDVLPGVETCNTPTDDDCDGMTNESGAGCVCLPNMTSPCYTGPAGTQGVGICLAGTQTCNAQGTAQGMCMGQVLPGVETCNTPTDDDCDGMTNESGAGCVCLPNMTSPCYTGPAGTQGVGICLAGTQTCNAQGTAQGMCMGQVLPGVETCNTPTDDDCDGMTNESGAGCVCIPNSTAPCYTGPAGTQGVGICAAGTQTCNAQGTAFGMCVGQVLPVTESCMTPQDDNCDGTVNEGCTSSDPNCIGGVSNGTCQAFESCLCGDCVADAACQSTCVADGACTLDDDCVCDDCDADSFCGDSTNCIDDGVCAPFSEGCICTDCATNPACLP